LRTPDAPSPFRPDPAALADQRDALAEQLLATRQREAEHEAELAARIDALQSRMTELDSARTLRFARAFGEATRSWQGLKALPGAVLDILSRRVAPPPPTIKGVSDEDSDGAVLPDSEDRALRSRRLAASRVERPLRIIAVVDAFTEAGLRGECELLMPGPRFEESELDAFGADLLFVESAWRGNGGTWRDVLSAEGDAVLRLLQACRRRGIPTVFWNKEDPAHYLHFRSLARHFDLVLTTDADCLPRYRSDLRRKAVHLFPFACQPRMHDPIHKFERKDAFCFAGSHYAAYPERARDFGELVDVVQELGPVDIFDRNHGSGLEEFAFPARYQPMIRGQLPPDRVDEAYKAYRFAINLNSIKHSPTMFARRVFELMASGTIVVSNRSAGMQRLLGDLVVTAADTDQLRQRLAPLVADARERNRVALLGLRKVMSEHTWQDRLALLRQLVFGHVPVSEPVRVRVVAPVATASDLERVRRMVSRQSHLDRRLLMVAIDPALGRWGTPEDEECLLGLDEAGSTSFGDEAVAGFWPDDHYGPHYLLDAVLAARYTAADVVGKACYLACDESGGRAWVGEGQQYRRVDSLGLRRAVWFEGAQAGTAAQLCAGLAADAAVDGRAMLALDEFNYCSGGRLDDVPEVDDGSRRIDQGVSLAQFLVATDATPGAGD